MSTKHADTTNPSPDKPGEVLDTGLENGEVENAHMTMQTEASSS